ncbi:hypothetical protein Syun_014943 [Stephania yunnanensis]|uniref:Uncharacterized protein n=1 Tax=Stephania yunnanensis TaxID=152371 RepID=A0AAP0JKA0_9MAGN
MLIDLMRGNDTDYYGVLRDVIRIDYHDGSLRKMLFKCVWIDGTSVISSEMAILDNAFQADQNENMDIVEVDVDPLTSVVVDLTSEIVSDNDEFETNADVKKMMSSHRHQTVGRSNPEEEDVEDINTHPEETSTTGRGSLSHHATPAHPDGQYSLHYTSGWSHVTRPYPTYAPEPSSSHYTSSLPPGHLYPYQHDTPSPPVHALPARHGIIPSSSHHSTPSPPADVYPYDHGISSLCYITPHHHLQLIPLILLE